MGKNVLSDIESNLGDMEVSNIIELKGISKFYRRGDEELHVLDNLQLSAPVGEFLALMGPSGSGKSTLLNMVAGLDYPDQGEVIVKGTKLNDLSENELTKWRLDTIGFVFQSFNLIPVLSAVENVILPLSLLPMSKAEREQRAQFVLEIVGLSDRLHHLPGQLSGGQEQRVAIARALVTDPSIIVADEPTGDLDRKSAAEIMELLRVLNKDYSKTIVMVTHDQLAATYASKELHLDKGKLLEM